MKSATARICSILMTRLFAFSALGASSSAPLLVLAARPRGRSRDSRDGCPARTNGTTGTAPQARPSRGDLAQHARGERARELDLADARAARARGARAACARASASRRAARRGARATASCEGLCERDLEAVAHLAAGRRRRRSRGSGASARARARGRLRARARRSPPARARSGRACGSARAAFRRPTRRIDVEEERRVGLQARMHEALEAHHEIARRARARRTGRHRSRR